MRLIDFLQECGEAIEETKERQKKQQEMRAKRPHLKKRR